MAASSGSNSTTAQSLDVDMIIVSAGIRPRDDLAKQSGLDVGERGGIVVNDRLETSDFHIYAIGECALHGGMIYGLVAPGYEMAEIVAANLTGGDRQFRGADLSTKLKLMGVDVASFGKYELPAEQATPLSFEDPFAGVYKKLLFSPDGTRLLGGILGRRCVRLRQAADAFQERTSPLPCQPHELIVGKSSDQDNGQRPRRDARLGSSLLVQQRRARERFATPFAIKVLDTLDGPEVVHESRHRLRRLRAAGGRFAQSRNETGRQSGRQSSVRALSSTRAPSCLPSSKPSNCGRLASVIAQCGSGNGCEVCKPAVTSILASLWNENIMNPEHQTLQDTNDRFLANMQRGRFVLGRSARSRRRNYAGQTARHRRCGQAVRALHQDHRRPTDRYVRRPGAGPAGHLGRAGERRLRKRPRLRQSAADRQKLRRHDVVPLRRAGFGRLRHSRRKSLQGNSRTAQNQNGRFRLHSGMCRGADRKMSD